MNPTRSLLRWITVVAYSIASFGAAVSVHAAGERPQLSTTNHQLIAEQFGKSSAVFIENRGQWADETIRFALSSGGVNVGLTDDGLRFQLFQREQTSAGSATVPVAASGVAPLASRARRNDQLSEDGRRTARRDAERSARDARATRIKEFSVSFPGARRVTPLGEEKAQAVFHYRIAQPSTNNSQLIQRENVPSWNAAVYRGLWNGIDLRVLPKRTGIKYEFIVAPGDG